MSTYYEQFQNAERCIAEHEHALLTDEQHALVAKAKSDEPMSAAEAVALSHINPELMVAAMDAGRVDFTTNTEEN